MPQPKAAPLVRVYEAVHKLKVELDTTSKELVLMLTYADVC
jgi:hypothetical protein